MSTCQCHQCDFRTAAADTAALDPHKRVRYSTGLVLGVFEEDLHVGNATVLER